MRALLVLALARSTVAYYDGPRGYCSPFTARYLTYLPSDDVLVFHGGHRFREGHRDIGQCLFRLLVCQ